MSLNNIATRVLTSFTANLKLQISTKFFLTIICGLILNLQASALGSYTHSDDIDTRNRIHKEYIKTVEVRNGFDYPSYPIINLNSVTPFDISFDDLSGYDEDYLYKVIHCSYDWIPSELEYNEYISGFEEMTIPDIEPSFNSSQPYINYHFQFPNDMIRPTLSGNYLLQVYPEDDEDNPILSIRLVVFEELIRYRANVKESSVISERKYSQELDFDLVFNGYDIRDPYSDVKNVMLQNFNWDTSISELAPIYVRNDEMTYDYGEENNFKGGNEFRYIQTRNIRSAGPGMDSISTHPSTLLPSIYLTPDVSRKYKLYTTNPDINGDFKVNTMSGFDDLLEAEYCRVYFYLERDTPLANDQKVFVSGNFNLHALNSKNQMMYDYKKKRYEYSTLMKQGFYNYRYVLKSDKGVDISFFEGSHFQTENDFHVITYDRNPNLGYDRVIGLLTTNTFNE